MTSKEALEMIVVDLVPKAKENNKEEIEQIEKDLENFEWLKSKLNLTFLNSLSSIEDKERLLEIMGVKISYDK